MRRGPAGTLILAALITLGAPVLAQGGFGPASTAPPPIAPRRRTMDELGLSPAQRRQLNQMRRTSHAEQSRLGTQIRALRRELADLYRAYPLDATRASSLVEQISQMESQRLRLQLQIQVELRRILTPQQFARFTQITESNQRSNSPLSRRVP
jgi:Spy/CpxP family protein refolding chaperone